MVKSKQLQVGNATEERLARYFQSMGFWVYILPKKIGGQPFDIIAGRNREAWFVDAKHLEASEASFDFKRIEPNQITSMKMATEFAHLANVGFFIYWERKPDGFFFMPYRLYKALEKIGRKSVGIEELVWKPISEVK